jgi:hypothetical protein
MLSSPIAVVCMLLAPPASAAPGDDIVIERVLAVVDRRPVLLSEVRLIERLRNVDQRAALGLLIDELLMYAEARRFAQARPSPGEEAAATASLVRQHLDGVSETELRRVAQRQATIVKYISLRLRPLVRVSEEAVVRAYEEARREHVASASGATAAVAVDELRERLTQRELDARVEEWTRRLRENGNVDYPEGREPPAP